MEYGPLKKLMLDSYEVWPANDWTPDFIEQFIKRNGYDYDYINEDIILNRMTLKDGKLMLPHGMAYRMMVQPDREAISLPVLKRLGELVEAGATIVGRKPLRSNTLICYPACDDEVRDLANRIVGDVGLEPAKRVTRTNVSSRFTPNTPLLPSGLLGPVKLSFPVNASCDL